MKLIASRTSPYARKIRVILLEKNIPFEFLDSTALPAGVKVADFNPLGKVPSLQTDDGECFFDSPIIAAYLETLGEEPALVPNDSLEAVRVRQLEALADGVMDAAIAWMLETRRPPEKQDEALITRQKEKVERGLDMLEKRIKKQSWFYGNGFGLADIAAACCVLWMDFRLPEYDWRKTRPALSAHVNRLVERPSFAETRPEA